MIALRRSLLTSLMVFFVLSGRAQQNNTVRLSAVELTVRQALAEMEKQTGKFFGYSDQLDLSQTLRFDGVEVATDSVLAKIAGCDFVVEKIGNYILIYHNSLADPTGTISGRIVDAANGQPLGGRITLSDTIRLWVDRSGYFRTEQIPEGEYLARVAAEGYRPAWRQWTTEEKADYRNTVQLTADTLPAETPQQPLLAVESVRPDFAEYLRSRRAPKAVSTPLDLSDYRIYTPVVEGSKGEPRWAVKTNALWWAAGTPNVAVERRLNPGWSAEVSLIVRPGGGGLKEKSLRYRLVQPEIRYWFNDTYEKHFVGLHATYGGYEIGHRNIGDIVLLRDNYLDGNVAGLGATYGYHLPMSPRWGAEFSIGVGYLRLKYDRYADGIAAGVTEKEMRHYFGPTKIGVSFLYLIR
jgi:hypothetical protein